MTGSERPSMQLRSGAGDGFRISVSSTPSCSSGGSGPDDIESLGDVYLWGELWVDAGARIDALVPKPLESNVVLDVHHIACGTRHAALVTRQGEVFTWGEESGGRLGHGVDRHFDRPRLVEFLAVNNVDFVACGEYHSCAISTAGDLFTWGDGAHNAGLLGHGTDVSHWIPKRVHGPLDGLQVLSVACGTWHSALSASNGKVFTFGDGAFGVLGHGDRLSCVQPREVQLLSGLKTVKVACGVWHTAAIVEVAGPAGSSISSKKLFTWGDGDKHRLGHGNKDTYLVPTCVSSLLDYNFQQLACGHTMTVALTTSGHVFTMGGTANGQLGNPSSDGRTPCLVQDRLVGEFVEEISCGASHVAVLTSRSEVFTWGKGSNGRLGHGDTDDRRTPTLVEALKDRHVKSIACGSNFTTSICLHKWVSGADQSVCSGCRQAFGFTRKRHNCYNCGLVHCHGCSSRKAFRAALAPTPGKPHRVCDACHAKLRAAEAGGSLHYARKATANPRRSVDSYMGRSGETARSSKVLLAPGMEIRPVRAARSAVRESGFAGALLKVSMPMSPRNSISSLRPSSPYARKPSPPRSATPAFSRSVMDNIKKSNELLTQELAKKHTQVKSLKQKCDVQDMEIQKLRRDTKSTVSFAEGQSSKCKLATHLLQSFTVQMKALAEKLSPEDPDNEVLRSLHAQADDFLDTGSTSNDAGSERDQRHATGQSQSQRHTTNREPHEHRNEEHANHTHEATHEGEHAHPDSDRSSYSSGSREDEHPSPEEGPRLQEQSAARRDRGKECTEQFEPGVYVTLIQLRNGAKVFRRVRFSKRLFAKDRAEEWWNENKERVFNAYASSHRATAGPSNAPVPTDEASSSTHHRP